MRPIEWSHYQVFSECLKHFQLPHIRKYSIYSSNMFINELENYYTFLVNVNSRSRSLYAVAHPYVCRLSVRHLSVTLVRLTQTVEIFGNISRH